MAPPQILRGRNYHLHLTDEETEAPRGNEMCPSAESRPGSEPECEALREALTASPCVHVQGHSADSVRL